MRGILCLLRLCVLAVPLAALPGAARAAGSLPALLILDPGSGRQLGSATVIAERLVVTSRHVIEPAVRRGSGVTLASLVGSARIEARVLVLSSRLDLAVLEAAQTLPIDPVRATAVRPPPSLPVLAQAAQGATLRGRVESFPWSPHWGPAIFVRLQVAYGSSGGPVVDHDGGLVGIITAAVNPSARQLAALASRADADAARSPGGGASATLVLLLPADDVGAEVRGLLAACCAARLGGLRW